MRRIKLNSRIESLSLIGASLVVAACLTTLSGCAPDEVSGQVVTEQLTRDAARLPATLKTAVYLHEQRGETWCILSDLSDEEIQSGSFQSGQIVRVELLWIPRPGSTPMDRDATNVSIRHVIFAEGEVGVFEGGGFALPTSDPGDEDWTLEIRNSTLALVTSTPDFHDRLSPARLTGSFTARLDPVQARRVRNAISQRVTDLLNRSWRADACADVSPEQNEQRAG